MKIQALVLLTKYLSGDQIKKSEMGMACSMYGEAYRCLQRFSGKPEGRRPLRVARRRWEDNIKMYL
jgi:hypothetical protein